MKNALLGGLTPTRFLREIWHKRPLLIRNAVPGFSCLTPNGAFYAFPNVSGVYGRSAGSAVIGNSNDFAAYLLEKANVAVVAGGAFGADNNIRLSYATSMDNIERGIDRIEKAVKELT